ncbi:helix-turn-helix transcriptional regulator [Microbacterium sp. H1-D42]|uniref:helix-turn-helix transcriptional regulator n=1 Tax=Microbacterium sp. H1-D42 TaxID=2925844 RepID=UPI001F53BF05|nr:helix-turn-helix transcriptional regulator [Microbacterium sp. H1-D42]UNK69451.1 helix-turn-helix transcriptional regulator [Microbacterium sp. H1-D42]
MDHRSEVREFLSTRRARLTPDVAGIIGGGRRRVPGLRREEVAMLAGVSVDYYARMERGDLSGVSREVLDALARALHLDEAEVAHLRDLAGAATPARPGRGPTRTGTPAVRPGLQRLLDAISAPAYIANTRKDFLAVNAIGRALFSPIIDDPANGCNNARFTFFNPAARIFYPDWETGANSIVASLRVEAGRAPHDKALTDLIGELVTRSDVFRTRWAAHDVRFHRTGSKRIRHPEVGDFIFDYEALELPADPGLLMYTMVPAVDAPTEERLRLLGSLAASRPLPRASTI